MCTIRAGSPHFYDVIPMDYVKQFKFQMENLMLDYRIKSCDFDVYDVFKDLGLQYEQSVGVNSGGERISFMFRNVFKLNVFIVLIFMLRNYAY